MENEILVGRFNRLLQKMLSMKGPVPSPQLSGDIISTLVLENDRPEWGFLAGDFYTGVSLSKAAVAAANSFVGVFNGQATGAMAVLLGILIRNDGAAARTYQIILGGTTGLFNTIHGVAFDARFLNKLSTCVGGNGSEPVQSGTVIAQPTIPPTTSQLFVFPGIVLPPNGPIQPSPPNVIVENTVQNDTVAASFFWRERALEPSEGPVPGA